MEDENKIIQLETEHYFFQVFTLMHPSKINVEIKITNL